MTAGIIISGPRNRTIFIAIVSLVSCVAIAHAQGPKTNRLPGDVKFVRIVEHSTACQGLTSQVGKGPQPSSFSGCVRGADQSAGPIHVRMLGYTGTISDTDANKSGEFLFGDVPAGSYFLYINQGPRILAIATIWVPSKLNTPPMVVDLGPHPANTNILYIDRYLMAKSE
jgi:hypothetical protein